MRSGGYEREEREEVPKNLPKRKKHATNARNTHQVAKRQFDALLQEYPKHPPALLARGFVTEDRALEDLGRCR